MNVRLLIDGIVHQTTERVLGPRIRGFVQGRNSFTPKGACLAHELLIGRRCNMEPIHELSPRRALIELVPGAVVAGRYQLERALGQGGMGVVWAAMHTVMRKRVALKFLRGPIHLRPELRRRFLLEARAAAAVVHPNVLAVHDVFELEDQTLVMLMDLLEGETLGARLAREQNLSLGETADILVQLVSAIETAHAAGVVHRDLKPDNVFLVKTTSGSPSVRVLDFGIAKLVGADGPTTETGLITAAGSMLGTPC
jgi:serine/threonine-protein kinase